MQNFKLKTAQLLAGAISDICPEASLGAEEIEKFFEYPPDSTMGDVAFPCFRLSKVMRSAPPKIAAQLSEKVADFELAEVVAVGGYLNFKINPEYLANFVLPEIEKKGDKYGSSDIGVGKTVVLDYSSPNICKPFHIGHLGTTVIGHSLKLLHQFVGYECVGINYLGDWGTQFGKQIVAFRKWGNREVVENGGIDELVKLYVKFHAEAEIDPSLNDEARAEFHKLEEGDEENLALWRWFVGVSLEEYQRTYKQLGIEFDSYKGESFYTDKMPAQVEKLRQLGIMKIDDGASIVDLEEYGMPPCLILKRDGSTLYPTRDIAAAVYRKETYDFDKAIYVTSAGQSLHFKQWFKVVELMGYDWFDKLVHVPYGTVSINGAKLATRTGNVILLKDLFALAIEKVAAIMEEKNPNLANKDEIAEAVGVGAIVFYYLSGSRMKDINFVMEEALSFDGNTGPYVHYTYARSCSVLEKGGKPSYDKTIKITTPEEADLVKTISLFEEKVIEAIESYEPSVIIRYILDVAAAFNRFYHNCSILGVDDEDVKNTRLMLADAVKCVLGNAFGLVCIKKTEKI